MGGKREEWQRSQDQKMRGSVMNAVFSKFVAQTWVGIFWCAEYALERATYPTRARRWCGNAFRQLRHYPFPSIVSYRVSTKTEFVCLSFRWPMHCQGYASAQSRIEAWHRRALFGSLHPPSSC